MPRPFKLALVQMLVEGGEKGRNLDRAVERIAGAAADGADLALLPEALDLGWTDASARDGAEPVPAGGPFQALSRAARECGIHVCAGLTERDGDAVFNTAVMIDDEGVLLHRHRKLNELEIGHDIYDLGDRLGVCETRFGRLGLMICADAFAVGEVVSRSLAYMGADIILSPCAWAVPADHDNQASPYGRIWREVYGTVSRDYSVWIAGVSNVGPITTGPWAGRRCIGNSLVFDDRGTEVIHGPHGVEADAIIEVDVRPVKRPARGEGWSAR